jgi:hypothetical protein
MEQDREVPEASSASVGAVSFGGVTVRASPPRRTAGLRSFNSLSSCFLYYRETRVRRRTRRSFLP